eukprot:EG_transcript_13830
MPPASSPRWRAAGRWLWLLVAVAVGTATLWGVTGLAGGLQLAVQSSGRPAAAAHPSTAGGGPRRSPRPPVSPTVGGAIPLLPAVGVAAEQRERREPCLAGAAVSVLALMASLGYRRGRSPSWRAVSVAAGDPGQLQRPEWMDNPFLYAVDVAPYPEESAFSAADLLPLAALPPLPATGAAGADHGVTGWLPRAVAAAEKPLQCGAGAAPLALLGMARAGERTTALIEFGAALQAAKGLPVLYINLGADTPFVAGEAYHPIQSLVARICYAARRDPDPEGVLGVLHDETGQLAFDVQEGLVEEWLGDTPFVLLVDHLDQLTGEGPSFDHLGALLRDTFLDRPGRFLAFTSSLGATRRALPHVLPPRGNPVVLRQQLPLVTLLW